MQVSEFRGQLSLGARLAGSLGRIALDRVVEGLGHSLPRTQSQLANPEAINQLFREFTPLGQSPLPSVQSVALSGVDFESSNCTNFLIDLEFGDLSQDKPSTAYVKIPCPEIATRAFANAVGFWEVEEAFCERVASRVPIRVPRVYAVARRGARFVLLLENLGEIPGTRMFINRDMAAGTTIECARMCLQTFAELHAEFWDWPQDEQEALLPRRLHVYLAPGGRARTQALNAASIDPAHRSAPEIFTREDVAVCRRAIQKWDALVDYWYDGPLTLVHGDSHLANCFEYPGPHGPQMGMIDFQGMHWCKGIRDVQYFLINSLEPEVLVEHEAELIDFYIAELAMRGVSLDPIDARDQYCGYSFQTLMVALTSIGLGTLTERDETVRTILRRSVAAMNRLDFASWLDRL
ncbi:MAG: phosphotransferase [Myxococcota bacterium]|nr:phosphotransferase [Myxococcota bacterium]